MDMPIQVGTSIRDRPFCINSHFNETIINWRYPRNIHYFLRLQNGRTSLRIQVRPFFESSILLTFSFL
jgi:hypothetical protein